jgi:DNA-binding HxlR family transcriptional regulator
VLTSNVQAEVCDDECPIKKTADVIEGRWTTLVIRELLPGKKRFSEIQRALTGISPKVLTARLRLLERRQVLTRTVFATVPPKTEYELTPLGRQLEAVLDAMADFGQQLSSDAANEPNEPSPERRGILSVRTMPH